MSDPVLVGVDGSEASLAAVDVAVREARLRGCGLRIVHAFIWPLMHVSLGPAQGGPAEGGLRHQAENLLEDARARARALDPRLEIGTELVTGEPLTVLARRSRDACLVVVGSRGLGRFGALLIGSVAVHLAAHAACPVLIVRGRPEPDGPVLVAVDGSETDTEALGFAFAEASARRAPLTALHVAHPGASRPDHEERALAEAPAVRRDEYPDVELRTELIEAHARPALIDASRAAQLLVVGARGRGGFAGMLLGSTSQAVIQHAHCPVVVVRHEEQPAQAPAPTG
ncbi:universal stress protein [Kitasatospora purpeofusca]|uniref:universal stress protein n=1 Tax=Kitasatospora purpeofusca TaxID=67352 RepID=UPI002A5AEE45|nr:universal stress protein [Kitasatospora purpeofusca]MDY0815650.1 universal stress protein [Kitasatospora purpeofusca]